MSMTAKVMEIRDRIAVKPDADIRQEVLELCDVLAAVLARMELSDRAAKKAANDTGCLLNGITPD